MSHQQPLRDLFLGSPAPGFFGRGIVGKDEWIEKIDVSKKSEN